MSGPSFPMPSGYLWQYQVIVWMQEHQAPWVDHVVRVLSWAGTDKAYLLILPVIFWSVHKRFGLRLAFVFLASMYVNGWLKEVLSVVRPSGIPGIRTLAPATGPGYSLPSGHTQGALTFLGALAMALKRARGWAWLAAFVIAFGIGMSRVYGGLHWPIDVVIGLALGALFSTLGWMTARWWTYRNYHYRTRAVLGVGIPLLLLVLERGPTSAQYAAWTLGAAIGVLLEERYIACNLEPQWWRRLCTAVIGMAGLIALQWVIQWPVHTVWWIVLRGILVGAWCTLGAPYVFVQSGLYRRVAQD